MIHSRTFIVAKPPSSSPCPDDPKRSVKVLWSNRDCETDCLDYVLLLENTQLPSVGKSVCA